jgi:altronate hydrolase
MKNNVLKINDQDNVLVALQDLEQGTTVVHDGHSIMLQENIPAKHKFFINDMQQGEEVIMYGVLVGKMQQPVLAGSRMSTENLKHAAGAYGYRHVDFKWQPPDVSRFAGKTFKGFYRSDGRVGTANYWLFIPTVFCENRNLDVIKEALHNQLGYGVTAKYKSFVRQLADAYEHQQDISTIEFTASNIHQNRVFKNIDGIKFLNHQGGCGGIRQDAAVLSKLLAAYANHPNVAGITMLSLGCQNLQVPDFLADLKNQNPSFDKPLYIFEQQQSQSEEQLVSDAIKKTFEGLIEANKLERQPASLDKLCLGVKCGGSDGFSGISANPAVGYTADLLVALGGKVILAEFPELCGVEQNLIDRTIEKEKAEKFIDLMRRYETQVPMRDQALV